MKQEKIKNLKAALFVSFLLVFCLLSLVTSVRAQVQLETALPNIPGAPNPDSGLPEYINYLFIFGLGAIAFLALAQMMIGGLTYILAAGNVAKVEDAKDTIRQALLGLGLLLVSYLLLRTINPDLVNLRNPNLTPVQFEAPTGPNEATGPNEPPQPGRPSVLIYSVALPEVCANIGGQILSPCQTYCLATPGLCNISTICCGMEP